MDTIERPKSLTEIVLDTLRERIVHGDLTLGQSLSERQIADELGVSKTPVREAIAQLRNEGLVNVFPQRGAYVFTLSAMEVIDICDFRLALENSALAMAMDRNHTALVESLNAVVEAMRSAQAKSDTHAYLALDTAFHAAFFQHCGNHHLRESYNRFVGKIAALRTHLATKPMHTKLSFAEHEQIAAAVGTHDAEKVGAILKEHIGRTRKTYSKEIDDIAAADRLPPPQ